MSTDYSLHEPLAVELMNTINFVGPAVHDAFEDDAGVAAWIGEFGDRISAETGKSLDGLDELDSSVISRMRELRDALRRLAAEATDDPRPPAASPELTLPDAIKTLNALARTWPELVWPAGGQPVQSFRTSGTAGDLAIGLIAHQAVELFAGPGRERLRACIAPGCLLFFFKRNTRRDWCSPGCGNRARVARHYQRHQAVRQH